MNEVECDEGARQVARQVTRQVARQVTRQVARQVMSSTSFQSMDRNGLCKQRLIEYFAYKQPCAHKTQVPNYCWHLFQNVCLQEKTMQTRS